MTEIKPIRNYPFRGKIYTAKQIDELIEQGGQFDPADYYDKTATDTLLATKQDVLTAGDNITIAENVISANAGLNIRYFDSRPNLIEEGIIDETDKRTLLKTVIIVIKYSIGNGDNRVVNIYPKGLKLPSASFYFGGIMPASLDTTLYKGNIIFDSTGKVASYCSLATHRVYFNPVGLDKLLIAYDGTNVTLNYDVITNTSSITMGVIE